MSFCHLSCRCGHTQLVVDGPHIVTVECLCESCQSAAQMLEALPGAVPILDDHGATPFVMHRKDRVTISSGQDKLKSHRVSRDATTRRVIATCCNTPMFMELKGGHWLSIYGALWPANEQPALEIRTMVGTRQDLPKDVPNLKTHSLGFYARLLLAWAKMGFRNPEVKDNGELDVSAS